MQRFGSGGLGCVLVCLKHHLIQNISLCVCVHVSVWAFVVTVNVPVCIFALRVCVCAHAPVSMTVTVLEAVPSVREILAFSMSLA